MLIVALVWRGKKVVPMNLNVLKAFLYLRKNKGKGTWEKAKRQ